MTNRLYVENLPPSATETSVRELFSKSGSVLEVKLMVDPSTGISRGRAFVTMATPDVAATAMRSFHSHSLGGRNIAVTEARPPAENPVGLIGHGFETGISQNQPQRSNGNHNGKPPRHQQQQRRRRR
jgi:RNA recognition motif-containing protein